MHLPHKSYLIKVILLGIIWFGIHKLASNYSLYYVFDWFDVFMHVFGGFWIGLIGVYFIFLWGRLPFFSEHKITTITLILLFVAVAGLVWELFEVFGGMTDIATDLWDTFFDLVCDMSGGALAIYLSKSKLWPKE